MTSNTARNSGPYSKALKCKILAMGNPVSYTGKDGQDKKCLNLAMSDGTSVMKLTCYDQTKFKYFKVGHTVVLREVIKRVEEGIDYIVVTKNSKVFISGPLEIPASHTSIGEKLINPPPAEETNVKEALASPAKKKVSVSGRIIQEEEIRMVKVRGEEVPIKSIMIEDETEKAKITLWRELAAVETRPGNYVQVTDVIVNVYNNQTSLQTTSRSTVTEKTIPEVNKTVMVEGICVDDNLAELFLEDETSLFINIDVLLMALNLETTDNVMENGSFQLQVVCVGSNIISAQSNSDSQG